jgi:plastocyanin
VTVQAKNIQFVTTTFDAPANKAFTIAFDNEDPGTAHDVALTDSAGKQVFKGDAFAGIATKTYDVPALPAGTYTFMCTIHPTMTGTATLK